jgi:hypothetical protein
VLLELVYLGLKVIDYVVSVCKRYSTVTHLFLQVLLHALDLQVLRGLKLLKLMGINLAGLLSRPQKDTCRNNSWSRLDERRRLLKNASSLM